MSVHRCKIYMQDEDICQRGKVLKIFLASFFKWPGNGTALNPIENLWMLFKINKCQKNSQQAYKIICYCTVMAQRNYILILQEAYGQYASTN